MPSVDREPYCCFISGSPVREKQVLSLHPAERQVRVPPSSSISLIGNLGQSSPVNYRHMNGRQRRQYQVFTQCALYQFYRSVRQLSA